MTAPLGSGAVPLDRCRRSYRGTRHATQTDWIDYATPYARLIMSITKKSGQSKTKTQWFLTARKDSVVAVCRSLNDRDRSVIFMMLAQEGPVPLDDKKASVALMIDVRKWRAARAELLAQEIIQNTKSGYELSDRIHTGLRAECRAEAKPEVKGDFSENESNGKDLARYGYGYGYGYGSKLTRIRKVMEDTGVDTSGPDRLTTDDILIAFDELDEVPQ